MGKRTGVYPQIDHNVAERLLHALDMYPEDLAKACNVKPKDIRTLLDNPNNTEVTDLWWTISDYLTEQIGLLLAAKRELDTHLQRQRASRATRIAMSQGRQRRSSPRS